MQTSVTLSFSHIFWKETPTATALIRPRNPNSARRKVESSILKKLPRIDYIKIGDENCSIFWDDSDKEIDRDLIIRTVIDHLTGLREQRNKGYFPYYNDGDELEFTVLEPVNIASPSTTEKPEPATDCADNNQAQLLVHFWTDLYANEPFENLEKISAIKRLAESICAFDGFRGIDITHERMVITFNPTRANGMTRERLADQILLQLSRARAEDVNILGYVSVTDETMQDYVTFTSEHNVPVIAKV